MDTLSSRITTIINAQRARRSEVIISARQGGGTTRAQDFLRLLCREGYLESFSSVFSTDSRRPSFRVRLKYNARGEPALRAIFRVSTPGRRVHIRSAALWQPQTSVGSLLLSTSRGLRTDREARQENLGGEVLRGIRLFLRLINAFTSNSVKGFSSSQPYIY